MSLFQKSVINKYLKNLDNDKVDKAFEKFQKFYGEKLRLHNIMLLKEENYQEGYLREIFVETLGYTINPDVDYNLTTEYKNQKDARKADGAILRDRKAIGVIELKSTKTKDLESIKEQAFSYKNNQPVCRYVITSNFRKLRFYIDNATEYEEFNLFNLTKKDFKLLYLLLSKESIFCDLPERLKEETKFHENDITGQLYNDYHRFKTKIFENLVKNNPQYDKLTLFKKSQKLLDRFLFIFFAEDSGLITPNTISLIIEEWKQLIELDEYKHLYKRFQKHFTYLNSGFENKKWGEIPAYNGGLFRDDELLDSTELIIDDKVLEKDSLILSAYDFNTEVDVNILGHIFEHSLNEIENITAQLRGEEIDKKKTKRKKDGIFYTPKYITKYIVENTVGKLCKEKKEELKINNLFIDESYRKTDGKLKEKGKKLYKTFDNYKKWLLTLKILDPACGSGAFLNATLDFLIFEHKQIDNLIAELTGDALGLFDTDKAILENNIYGVDINEESVEIAKLSMWLRTAQKGRPLSDLSGNIKCGNSLIDDPEVAGDKAFDWNKEFPQVFKTQKRGVAKKKPEEKPDYVKLIKEKTKEAQKKAEKSAQLSKEAVKISQEVYEYAEKLENVNEPATSYGIKKGGFDVVLGNPPYGAELSNKHKEYLENEYKTFEYQVNTYVLFYEKGINLIKNKGLLGYITPATFTYQHYFEKLRKLLQEYKQIAISKYFYEVFEDADIGDSVSWILRKTQNNKSDILLQICNNEKDAMILPKLEKYTSILNTDSTYRLSDTDINISNLYNNSKSLVEITKVTVGIKAYQKGKGIPKQTENIVKTKIFTSDSKIDNTYIQCVIGKNFSRYSFLQEPTMYLSYGKWLAEPRESAPFFDKEKIILRQTADSLIGHIDNKKRINLNNVYNIGQKNNDYNLKYILSLLNSKLLNFIYQNVSQEKGRTFAEVKKVYLAKLPIKIINKETQQPFIEKADQMLSLNKELQSKSEKFIKRIKSNLEIDKITGKLQSFYDYDFKTFIAELKKQKIKLSLTQQDEWEDYFDTYKKEINQVQTKISQTDKEIDKMVYELYELTEEEIGIVESGSK